MFCIITTENHDIYRVPCDSGRFWVSVVLNSKVHRLKLSFENSGELILSEVHITASQEVCVRRNYIQWMGRYELPEKSKGYYYIEAAQENGLIDRLDLSFGYQEVSSPALYQLLVDYVGISRENEILEELVRDNIQLAEEYKNPSVSGLSAEEFSDEVPVFQSCTVLCRFAEQTGGKVFFKNQLQKYDWLQGKTICISCRDNLKAAIETAQEMKLDGNNPLLLCERPSDMMMVEEEDVPAILFSENIKERIIKKLKETFLFYDLDENREDTFSSHKNDDEGKNDFAPTVNVIIPTYNGGKRFRKALDLLLKQKGFAREPEIILVDSGSTDGTPEYAETTGDGRVHIIRIPNEQFSHSYARNLGADNSKADIIVFMTQDAVPTSCLWLRRLAGAVEKECDAASCAELCPPQADHFFRISSYEYSSYIGTLYGDRVYAFDSFDDETEIRRKASLTDISCAIRREIFKQFRYENDYAEDLNLGMRLLRAGYKIGILGSVETEHYHNRTPDYYLKRNYVESRTFQNVFHDKLPDNKYLEKLYLIENTLECINTAVCRMRKEPYGLTRTEAARRLGLFLANAFYEHQNVYGDISELGLEENSLTVRLYQFCLQELAGHNTYSWKNPLIRELREYLLGSFLNFEEVMGTSESDVFEDLRNCLVKRAANEFGRYISSGTELWPGLWSELSAGV